MLAQVSSDGQKFGQKFQARAAQLSKELESEWKFRRGNPDRVERPQTRFNCLLRRLQRIVYTRRFDIVWYGSVVALAVAAGWLVSSILTH